MMHQLSGLGGSIADTFRALYLEADMEGQVALINNYWQFLWRCASGVPADTFGQLDTEMGAWWDWKTRFDAAVLQRWLPFQHDWQADLDEWADRWRAMYDKLIQTPGVGECLGERYDVQPQIVEERKSPPGPLPARPRRWVWPVLGGTGFLLAFAYVWRRAGRV